MQLRISLRLTALLAALLAVPAWAQENYDTSRVVAIGGSVTEIIYALGEEEKLVARDTTSVYPQAALDLPDIGYMRALSPEGVLSVNPTLIIALEGSGPPETVEVLEKASVPLVSVPEAFDREGILEKIRIVGEVLSVEDKAEKLIGEAGADLAAAEAATAGIEERAKVLFILSVQSGRILASGTGTAANGIIAMAGGVNAITDYQGYKQLSDEAIIEAAPDVILLMDRGAMDDDEGRIAELMTHPSLAATPAARNERVASVDGAFLLGFGPRTAAAVRTLSATLYGDEIKAD